MKSVMDDGGGGDARSVTHDVVDEAKCGRSETLSRRPSQINCNADQCSLIASRLSTEIGFGSSAPLGRGMDVRLETDQ